MRICSVINVHIPPVCFPFEGACRQGKTHLLFLSEKQAGQHKPCHIDLVTGPLTQMAFIWKQTIECVQYRCHLPRISLTSHKLKTEKVGSTSSGQ